MGMEAGQNKSGLVASLNVVPLIDILLVLLIIFMVITPLTPRGLDALVPQPAPPSPSASQPDAVVVVQVLDSGKLKLNGEDTSWETIGPRLSSIFKLRAEKVAFVKGDDAVQFADVARAIDIMRASGIDSVGLITAKMESGG